MRLIYGTLVSALIILAIVYYLHVKSLHHRNRKLEQGLVRRNFTDSSTEVTTSDNPGIEKAPDLHLPEKFRFNSSLTDKDLVFSKVSFPKLKKLGKEVQIMNLNNPMNVLPAIAVNSMAISGAQGLFRATVNPSTLMKYTDGTISSIIRGSKNITGKAGFQGANPAQIFAPLLIFQVASIVTGQYYLQGITKQLAAISRRLEHLIHLHHNEKRAILKSGYDVLQRIASKRVFAQEDISELRSIFLAANNVKYEYATLLNEIDESRYHAVAESAVMAKRKIDLLQRSVDEDAPMEYFQMVTCAERVSFAAKLLELKANVMLCPRDPSRVSNTTGILDDIQTQTANVRKSGMIEKTDSVFLSAHKVAVDCIKGANLQSSREYGDIRKRQFTKARGKVTKEYNSLIKELGEISEGIHRRMNSPREVLVIVDEHGNQQCAELLK